jgi:hypothetical protein
MFSPCSPVTEPDVTESLSLSSDTSLSDRESESDDGSYSCFRGDDGRRLFLMNAGVKAGITVDFKPKNEVRVDDEA